MPEVPEDEQRRMAEAIDSGLEPRVRLDAELSAEAADKLRDILTAVAADLDQRSGIEASWPLVRMVDLLSQARSCA
ncbi:MAG: hypothetical protein JWM73_1245 [Solirubrobacterales bacterium]|nr:hypothetical protein [Solirubrobacterales bacterium]